MNRLQKIKYMDVKKKNKNITQFQYGVYDRPHIPVADYFS